MKDESVLVTYKISAEQKRKLQVMANKNTDGNVTLLIKLFADGGKIK